MMIDAIRIVICGVMAILSLLASFGVDGTMHQLMEENARLDLLAQINGARKWIFFTAIIFVVLAFL